MPPKRYILFPTFSRPSTDIRQYPIEAYTH